MHLTGNRPSFLGFAVLACALALAGPAAASTPQSAYADEVYTRINEQRRLNGNLPALARLRNAELAASLHAMDMANREYMAHSTKTDPLNPAPVVPDPVGYPNISFTQGWGPGERLTACGFAWWGWGENVAYNWGYGASSPQVAVDGWMNSQGHRDNILNGSWQGTGVGCAVSATGKVYYCQVFVMYSSSPPTIARNADLWAAAPAVDTTAPAGWTGGTPTVTQSLTPNVTIKVSDAGSGLKVTSAQYQYSKDGGTTWSGWAAASCTGTAGTTLQQTITAASVPFNQESKANRIQFKISDEAGNWGTSPAQSVTTDKTAPGSWASFAPAQTTDTTPDCTVQVSDAVSGLNVGSAQYRYSTNSGSTWSAWAAAAGTGTSGTTVAQTITAAGVPFNVAQSSGNLIQFQIRDMAGVTGTSVTYAVSTASTSSTPSTGTAPGNWNRFSPAIIRGTAGNCTVRVTDADNGLNVASAQYRYSRDGGATWSAWAAASCTGLAGTLTEQTITAASVPFNQQSTQNRVQFQIADIAGAVGTSPIYSVTTDGTGPGSWASFAPLKTPDTTPNCTVQVSDTLSGLNVTSAIYRYSTDGGVTYSAWAAATCTGTSGTTAVQTITAANVPFNVAHATNCRIQFRITDRAGNIGLSPSYTVNTTP